MASEEELSRIYNLFADCWRFFKKHADVQDTDEYWQQVIDEGRELSKKYNNDKFAVDLMTVSIGALERKAKEVMNNAEA